MFPQLRPHGKGAATITPLLGLLLLAGACASGQPAVSQATIDTEWEGCEEIRQSLDPEAANLTFSALDLDLDLSSETATWPLHLGDLSVELPQGDYELLVSPGEDTGVSIILVDEDLRIVITGWADEPIEDIWMRAVYHPTNERQQRAQEQSTEERKQATFELFNGYPTVHDLQLIAFQHTLDDLSCAREREKEEVPVAIALILGSLPNISVHHNHFGLDEITYLQSSEEGDLWSLSIRVPGELTREIALRAADQQTLLQIAAATHLTRSDDAPTTPEDVPGWLPLLSTAAQNPSDAQAWQALEEWLEQNGASERSLNSLRQMY